MGWSPLGTQFCLELGFGVLLALACVGRAPLGPFFHRVLGTTALVPLLAAAAMPIAEGQLRLGEPQALLTALAVLLYPAYAGPLKSARRAQVLYAALACSGAALVLAVQRAELVEGWLELAVASASALATGAVAGGVGLAMVLGHWYLTIPDLDVRHLQRLNRVTAGAMLVSLAALGATCLVFAEPLRGAQTPLFGPWGLFYLGTRVAVGLALPILFAWMVASSLAYSNTRSATGILYASTVLVLIGTAVSISLQDSYGIPL
jgi:hypothetical protein